jgi:hypothetical protein
MSEQSESSFNYMTMFAFYSAILLMCMRAGNAMRNPKLIKESVEVAILAPPNPTEHE